VRLKVAQDLGRDGFFRGEGTARHEPDHEERRETGELCTI
jgi:hypothetical protein